MCTQEPVCVEEVRIYIYIYHHRNRTYNGFLGWWWYWVGLYFCTLAVSDFLVLLWIFIKFGSICLQLIKAGFGEYWAPLGGDGPTLPIRIISWAKNLPTGKSLGTLNWYIEGRIIIMANDVKINPLPHGWMHANAPSNTHFFCRRQGWWARIMKNSRPMHHTHRWWVNTSRSEFSFQIDSRHGRYK